MPCALCCGPSRTQVADRRAGRETLVPNAGASVTARPGGPPAARPGTAAALRSGRPGHHPFGWRDAMDILVRWRQLAEPNDQASISISRHVLLLCWWILCCQTGGVIWLVVRSLRRRCCLPSGAALAGL